MLELLSASPRLVSTDGVLADPSPGGGKEDDYIQLWTEVELPSVKETTKKRIRLKKTITTYVLMRTVSFSFMNRFDEFKILIKAPLILKPSTIFIPVPQ